MIWRNALVRTKYLSYSRFQITLNGLDSDFLESSILGLAEDGRFGEALQFFQRMNSIGIKSTKFILCSVISSCLKSPDIFLGLQLHAITIRSGYESNIFLGSKLVDLYSKSGEIDDSLRAFKAVKVYDQVLWTSVISGLSQNGRGSEALMLLKEMMKTEIRPSGHIFASIISSCKMMELAADEPLSLLHSQVIKSGFDQNSFVVSSLIDFYLKRGELDPAVSLFKLSNKKDIILYNSMISGFSLNMLKEEAVMMFLEMLEREMNPTGFTLASLLNTSGSLVMLYLGKSIHSFVVKLGWSKNLTVSGSLVDMYSKCGAISEAQKAFDYSPEKNRIMFTSMITGYAQNGKEFYALQMFEKMLEEGREVDHLCFTAALTACNHGGFVDQGIYYFNLMKTQFGLSPEVDQYACMVDLLGRAGRLTEAKELMEAREINFSPVLWSSFLSSCRIHGDIELGKEAAKRLYEKEPNNSATYISLARSFALFGMWDEVAETRGMLREKGTKTLKGCSWVEIGCMIHSFLVGDRSHPDSRDIYEALDLLSLQMKESF